MTPTPTPTRARHAPARHTTEDQPSRRSGDVRTTDSGSPAEPSGIPRWDPDDGDYA